MEGSPKVFYQVYPDDPLVVQADELEASLNELAATLERWNQMGPPLYRPVATATKHAPVLVFPFNLLAASITLGLTRLDAATARFVKTVIARWIHRLQRRLHIR